MEATVGLKREVSCRVTNSVLRYVESLGYEVDSIIEGLPYSREYLTDPFNWLPYDIRETICQRATTLVGDEAILYRVGLAAVELKPLGGLEHLVRLLGNPKLAYKSVPEYAAFLDKVFSFTTRTIGVNRAVVTMSITGDHSPSQNACYYAQGILAAIPTVWGLPPAEVKEEKCMCRPDNGRGKEGVEYGAEACTYHVTWQVTHPWYSRLTRLLPRRDDRTSVTISELEKYLGLLEQKNAELVRRNSQLAKVREIELGLNTASTVDEVLRSVVESGSDIPGVSSVIVQRLDESLSEDAWGEALRNSIHGVADISKTVIVPLIVNDRPWGSLNFYLENEVSQDILEMVGAYCAIALKNVTTTKALLESEEKYQALVENANEAIVVLNQEGMVAFANPKATEITGYSKEELTSKNIMKLIHPDDREPLIEWYRNILRGYKVPLLYLFRVITRDKGTRWIQANTVLITWENCPASLNLLTDVTESKEVEELYQTLANSSPVGVYIVQDRKVQFVNPRFQKYTGYTEDELLGMNTLNIVHPQDRERVRQNAVDMLKGKHPSSYEFRYISKSGETIWAMETVTPIQYKGKRATLGNFMDITERKKVEEALRDSRRRFRDLSNLLPQSVWEIDTDGYFTFVNQEGLRSYGYTLENVKVPLNARQVFIPEDRDRMWENIQRILNGEELGSTEYTALRKDGSTFPVLIYAAPIMRGNEAVGLRGVTIDLTKRKQGESMFRAQKELIDRILASIPNSVLVINGHYQVVLANREFCDSFNMKEKDVVGKGIDEVIRIKGLSKAVGEVSSNRQPQLNLEFRHKINDVERILDTSITPMRGEEILLILHDITDEREREERLYLTDRLASVGEMAAGIAHELNNPLSGVVALSQLLVESNLPDEIKEDVQDIHSEARRAAGIVKNLLTFSGRRKSGRQLTQINDVIEDVLKLRAYEQKANGIQVGSNLDPNLPEVIADYFQMQQVFLNIVLNAESAIASKNSHGELDVTTERVDGTVKVSFTDNGLGIPKENLSRIFDPFFTTKEVGQGTGLGLSLCYGIVTEHGGRLYTESELGKGATFVVELPIDAQ